MDKKGGDAAGSHRSNMSGDTVSARVLSDPEAAPDGLEPDRHEKTEQSDRSDVSQPSSASDKAEALPRKMWVLVTAGLLVWTIIAIAAMLLFF